MKTISTQIDGVEPCLDFAHLHARTGDGSMNSYEEWVEVLKTYSHALGKDSLRRLHCHVSGIEYSEKGERNHLIFEEADFDTEALFKALLKMDCAGRLLCESPILEEDALFLQESWGRIAPHNTQ